MELQVTQIKPDKEQPRKTFDEESLKFLAESILSNQLITPIDVDEDYIIIDGERRWKAHKIAGLKTISVRIVKLKKDEILRLRRQLISDIQDEEIPTGEKYEGIVKLWKMEKQSQPLFKKKDFYNILGVSESVVQSAFDYCEFAEEEPELAEKVSARVIADTKGLPKEERKEIIEAFKEIPKEEKKTDLMRELVKIKKKQIEDKKQIEELRKTASVKEIKITTDRDRAFQLRDEIIETQNHFNKLMSNVKWARKKKFFFQKPKQKDDFIKFLEGASERARKWANELDDLRESIDIEIIRE